MPLPLIFVVAILYRTNQKGETAMYRTIYSKQKARIDLDGREDNNYPCVMEAAKATVDSYGVGPTSSR